MGNRRRRFDDQLLDLPHPGGSHARLGQSGFGLLLQGVSLRVVTAGITELRQDAQYLFLPMLGQVFANALHLLSPPLSPSFPFRAVLQ